MTSVKTDIKRLAAKQKRILQWKKALSNQLIHTSIAKSFEAKLSDYILLIKNCGLNNVVSTEEAKKLETMERELEDLENESRLAARP